MLCPICGAPLADKSLFCSTCGNAIPASAPQPQQYAPQPQQYAPQPQQYAPQPQQYAPQPQQYAPQPQQYASQPQPYAAQPQQYASQPQPYAAPQPYAYPQAAVQAKPKNKLLLPLLIGGIVLLIGVGLLLYFLVFKKDGNGGSAAVKSDPQQIAYDVVRAYVLIDSSKIAPYTTVDFYEGYRQQLIEEYGSEQACYDQFREFTGYTVSNAQSMLEALSDYTDKNAKEYYGSDYTVVATLNEANSATYTGSEVADAISNEGRSHFTVDGVSMLDGVNTSDITELRIYYYDVVISGSKGSDDNWFKIYMGQIDGVWKLLGIY